MESQQGEFELSDSLYPVGTQLVLYDYTIRCIVMMEVYFTGSNI